MLNHSYDIPKIIVLKEHIATCEVMNCDKCTIAHNIQKQLNALFSIFLEEQAKNGFSKEMDKIHILSKIDFMSLEGSNTGKFKFLHHCNTCKINRKLKEIVPKARLCPDCTIERLD